MKEISAGGVVYRKIGGKLQIQLIQDRYGRTSLPKGKMEPGETVEQTALREILEETGIRGDIRGPLALIQYQYKHPEKGMIDKEVHYYLVEASGGELMPQIEEIRGVAWYEPLDAWEKQKASGYDNNDAILRIALHKLGVRTEEDEA
ncbi:NUDIX domain-containing protein [Paenibacillus antri]|uniref:NUDIX domain-containing protein n=1 Tax=Paenibacillus antri TaxID=2582848 RepID=A0A5R9G7H0_9BACL|nr:NUDIX domain-containing protein [Paenibacillus antri]TLS50326.1 NUDIX domain-containing protein [Paenibacillus antri]